MAYLRLNGLDVINGIEAGKLKWTENDIDAPDSGRTLDGTMHRGKVCSKVKLELGFLPLTVKETVDLMTAIRSEYIFVETDIDPVYGKCTREMYNSTRPASCYVVNEDGEGRWQDITLNLIER